MFRLFECSFKVHNKRVTISIKDSSYRISIYLFIKSMFKEKNTTNGHYVMYVCFSMSLKPAAILCAVPA